MEYKEFIRWCNDRAADGYWDLETAKFCGKLISKIQKMRWWKRNKIWKQNYEQDVVNDIVIPFDKMRKTWLGR